MPVSGCHCFFEPPFRACFSCAGLTHTQSQQARYWGGRDEMTLTAVQAREGVWGQGGDKGGKGPLEAAKRAESWSGGEGCGERTGSPGKRTGTQATAAL